jgi:hypothetical protein
MVAVYAALTLVLSSCLCLGESFSSFKNFPVVGLKKQEPLVEADVIVEQLAEDARAPRQAEITGYQDPSLDDTFIEEALFLTPEDREERDFSSRFEDWAEEETDVDNIEVVRPERDGLGRLGGHHGAAHHGGEHDEMTNQRQSRRGGRRPQQQFRQEQEPQEQQFRQEPEQRGGRQTGATGPALGLLSNPPNSDGDYNFNFSNEDGSSRQETAGPDGVKGSYSFITPEGEEVSIQYVADEFGFHATGSHVPQAPPMPPAIQRLLDHLAKVNGHAKLY